ncbi:MAG TPA: serine hydrolase [Caulobacterales bacterium]|nr:serine hydrolase [Caulobacterales bacterium]
MLREALIAASLLLTGAGPASAQLAPLPPQPADTPWPTQQWPTGELAADVNRQQLEAAMNYAFGGFQSDLGETRAVVIIQGGRLVYERYGDGYGPATRLISWSMAKSFTHALVGAAVLQGRVNIDAPLGSPYWAANDPRAAITWRQFLNFVDGQRWSETYATKPTENDSARMLYGEGRMNTARYGANQPLINPPGTHWNYNSGGTALLADGLTRAVVPDAPSPNVRRARMRAWMDQSLFDPMGMHPVVQFDPAGLFYGSAEIFATARDFARFGLLYLRDGVWDGKRLLPEGWVDFARTPGPDTHTTIYGAQFWLTPSQGTGAPIRSLLTDNALSDAFEAQGHEGQLIVIVPSKDLVIVRLGRFDDTGERWNKLGDWVQSVVQSFANRPVAAHHG